MHLKKTLIIILLPIVLSGCSLGLKSKKKGEVIGGIFRSVDMAENWENKSFIAGVGEKRDSFIKNSVNFIKFDPTDDKTVYAGILNKGLYVTWDGGNSWRPILTDKGNVVSLAVNPKSPCIVYASVDKAVYKTSDCGRRWELVFTEKRNNTKIYDIDIDSYDPENIFISLKSGGGGEIISSRDSGNSWQILKNDFRQGVRHLYINPKDTRIMYAALERGLWRTIDQGVTWQQLDKKLRDAGFKNGEIVYDMIFLPQFDDGFITLSKYGILRSENSGDDWQAYILLQKPNSVKILSLAVNLQNENEIYYTTTKGIYKSTDGGGNWVTLNSPTTFAPRFIKINPKNNKVLYLGSWQLKKK